MCIYIYMQYYIVGACCSAQVFYRMMIFAIIGASLMFVPGLVMGFKSRFVAKCFLVTHLIDSLLVATTLAGHLGYFPCWQVQPKRPCIHICLAPHNSSTMDCLRILFFFWEGVLKQIEVYSYIHLEEGASESA